MRIAWLDTARGLAILLVVNHHAILFLDAYGWDLGFLPDLTELLTTFRMPLFFVVSGVLASGAVARLSLRALFWRRIALLIYIYALWCLVRWLWFSFVPWPFDVRISPMGDLASALLIPWSGLWFVYGLAIYIFLAWVLRRLPLPAQLLIAFVVSALFASGVIRLGSAYTWGSIGTYFVFFMLGCLLSRIILRLSENLRWYALPVGTGVYVGMLILLPLLPFQSISRFAISFIGAAFGLLLAVFIARLRFVRNTLGRLGTKTLPVYVTHSLVIGAIAWLIPLGSMPAAIALCLTLAVTVSIGLLLAVSIGRFRGIFSLPGPIDDFARNRSE